MRRKLIASLAIVLGMCLLMSASTAPTVAKPDIVLGAMSDLSGPHSHLGRPFNNGTRALVDFVNAGGGIGGHRLRLLNGDDRYEPAESVRLYREFASRGAIAFIGGGTGSSLAVQPFVNAAGHPFLSTSYSALLTDAKASPYTFGLSATYADQIRLVLDYLSMANRTAKVAVFYDDSSFGRDPLEAGDQWVKSKRYKLGYATQVMQATATTYEALLRQVIADGVRYIIVQNSGRPAGVLARDISALNAKITLIVLAYGADESFVRSGGQAAEGHLVVQPVAPPRLALPGHADMRAHCRRRGVDLEAEGAQFVRGWYTALVIVAGLRKLVTGRAALSGTSLRLALETMGPLDTGGVVGGVIHPVKFSAESHQGTSAASIYKIQNSRLVEIATNLRPSL